MLAIASSPPATRARDRLLDAAIELFARHGFQAIGLRDLASHLGLHAGSLYHHIENKQCLLFELIESALSDLLLDTKRRMRGAKTPRERLRRFVQAFVAFNRREKQRLVLVTREFVNLDEEHQRQANQLKDAYRALLRTIIADEYKDRGHHEQEAGLITHAVMGLLYGQSLWIEVDISEQQLADLFTHCVTGMIAGGTAGLTPPARPPKRTHRADRGPSGLTDTSDIPGH
ncbi:AcrR family transcriptional regulator [Pseudomonas sp. TE12234]